MKLLISICCLVVLQVVNAIYIRAYADSRQMHTAVEVPVFFITNRKQNIKNDKIEFTKRRAPNLAYGYCNVIVPTSSINPLPVQRYERLGWQLKEKFHKTDIDQGLESLDSADKFYKMLQNARERTNGKLILFVHGYSMNFENTLTLSAKLAASSGSPVVVFAWASQNNPLAYSADECNAEWSMLQFRKLLAQFELGIGNTNITLISHSMGSRIVSWALQSPIFLRSASYEHILFCSPDMDTATFANYAREITKASSDVRVFVSATDLRLRLSKMLHGNSRLGMAANCWPQIEGVCFTKFVDHNLIGHSIPYDLISDVLNKQITKTAQHNVSIRQQ